MFGITLRNRWFSFDLIKLLFALSCLLAASDSLVSALRFDVTDAPTCLVYTLENADDIPRIELKYVSSFATAESHSGKTLASQLHIQTLDPNRREVNLEKVAARPEASATWKTARFMHRDGQSSMGRAGFSLAGDYSLCFRRFTSTKGAEETSYVELLVGDPHSLRLLEKQTLTTKGSLAKYTGSVRKARVSHNRATVETAAVEEDEAEESHLTEDEAEELNEWIDEIENQLEDVKGNFVRLLERHEAFQTTSNSLFTRIWFMATLTILAMASTLMFMLSRLKRTLIEKKLV